MTTALRAYAAVTAAYWAFMASDGALRMLVLLHFHTLGFSPLQLAMLFVLYEIAGIVTNLAAGFLAARFGLTSTLYAGLALQIAALVALTQLDPTWSIAASVAFVAGIQGASGVAKDLAKTSSKSAVKLLAPQAEGALFTWTARLTGSKNAIKGLGFFLGAGLLASLGFTGALWAMAAALTAILIAIALFLPPGLPGPRKSAKLTEILSTDPRINRLSAARLFLFAARDVWFVVGLPIWLHAALTGPGDDPRASFFTVGAFMAVWIILYGLTQSAAPRILGPKGQGAPTRTATRWAFALALILAALTLSNPSLPLLITGLLLFGAVFAVNSALHSYLILAFARPERVTMDVGFYYMANAGGRLLGTLLSGLSYQIGGLPLCLATAATMAALAALITRGLIIR